MSASRRLRELRQNLAYGHDGGDFTITASTLDMLLAHLDELAADVELLEQPRGGIEPAPAGGAATVIRFPHGKRPKDRRPPCA